jgi:ornithine decarboxylase
MKTNLPRRDGGPTITAQSRPQPQVGGYPVYTGDSASVIAALRPDAPLYIVRPDVLAETARDFVRQFPGTPMYAVKCNPDRLVLQTLWRGGVKSFDAASIDEVRLVRKTLPKAKIYFMHPVKAPEAIAEAYNVHGVRAFVLDTVDELHKILKSTNLAADLELFVRLALPKNDKALVDFSGKFGARPDDAVVLLQKCRTVGAQVGVSFHVGTQSLEPAAYDRAIAWAADIVERSGVYIDALDVGGGFPVQYPDSNPPPLGDFMQTIREAADRYGFADVPLLAEPGRALVATCGSLVVRVEQRRGDMLYINDGVYGGLLDAGPLLRMQFPVHTFRRARKVAGTHAYSFAGPTCDSIDMMPGPFMLPPDMAEGQWIEIGCMGAYSGCVRTNFNGFGRARTIALYEHFPAAPVKKTMVKNKN